MAIINPAHCNCIGNKVWETSFLSGAGSLSLAHVHAHTVLAAMSTLAAAPQPCPGVLHGGELQSQQMCLTNCQTQTQVALLLEVKGGEDFT